MLISLSDETILWSEEFIYLLPLHGIFDHTVHLTTFPIEVKALSNDYVIVKFVLAKEGPRNGPC